jgi:hypothetical protein
MEKRMEKIIKEHQKVLDRLNALEAQYVRHSHHFEQDIRLTNTRQGVQRQDSPPTPPVPQHGLQVDDPSRSQDQ